MIKKLFGILLGICMIPAATAISAGAAPTDTGAFFVDGAACYADGILTVTGDCTIGNADPNTVASDRIVVQPGTTANITLSDVNIDVSASDLCAFDMSGATVDLILEGTNILKSGENKAGLHVPAGAALVINGNGTLMTTGGYYGAGIGGDNQTAGGTITIKGGIVTATGGYYGAGIGGGCSGAGGTITIEGGIVAATGGYYAAGIGGGYMGAGITTISITGGIVNGSNINSPEAGDGSTPICMPTFKESADNKSDTFPPPDPANDAPIENEEPVPIEKETDGSDKPFDLPNSGDVRPKRHCPAYTLLNRIIHTKPECRYFRYADLHAPEVAICFWLKK